MQPFRVTHKPGRPTGSYTPFSYGDGWAVAVGSDFSILVAWDDRHLSWVSAGSLTHSFKVPE